MEPIRRPAGPRALLPAEVEMCQVLGITEADYWMFVDLAQAHNGERREGYELIPDIRCEPATTTAILVNLAIGVALTAVSVLLTPKPRSPGQQKAPPQLKTADATGPKRFATQAGFNTVQSVASLGEVIPLVFADYSVNQGGVRVSSNLLWSRMTSYGTTQQFEGIYLFSSGPLADRPDFEGFALGDSLITSYPTNKFRLIFGTNGGRPNPFAIKDSGEGMGQYSQTRDTNTRIPGNGFEIFRPDVGASEDFCGVRTPSSQTQFGAYAPMPNGMSFQLPYELVLIPNGQGRDVKNRAREKRRKLGGTYFIGAAITTLLDGPIQSKGTRIFYEVTKDLYDGSNFGDWGRVDINQEQETRRVEIDSNIGIGSSYLVGQTLTTCTEIFDKRPFDNTFSKTYQFTVSESSPGNNVETATIGNTGGAYQLLTIQRVALATISNSRPCNVTEIGIRSNVWKQINFANVNTQPSDGAIADFEDEGGNITLGQVNKYITRYSFFGLQARTRGSSTWTNLNGTTNIFCIKGNTPQDQYNYLFIEHPLGQYEFRLIPIPGNSIYKYWVGSSNNIWQLRPGVSTSLAAVNVPGAGQFRVYFAGTLVSTAPETFYNKEYIVGKNLNDLDQSTNPFDALADYLKYSNEGSSHSSAPEHEVVYVNEVIYNDQTTVGASPVFNRGSGPQYDNLANAGLNLWSDKEWSSLSELSAFFKYGVKVKKPSGGTGATNLLPEIVYALLTDETIGAGKLIGANQVNAAEMANAAKYCRTNKFTWNGVLTDRVNLREWIFENAAYCLLDFTIIGGKFSLRPTPITNSNGAILRSAKPTISALFTDGNIRDLKVVFLDPEERKPFKAVCLYREDSENGFPETRVVTVRASGGSSAVYAEEAGDRSSDPEETFDMTQFCTVPFGQYPTHPVTFAQVAIRTRTLVTHSVTFQTTPEMAMGLEPGEYFRLVSEATHTSRFNNGAVSADGVVTSTTPLSNGNYSVYYWTPGSTFVSSGTLQVLSGRTKDLRGTIFTLKNSTTEDRIYKLESLSYAEDGLVEVTGSHVPLTSDTAQVSGALAIMDDRGFDVEIA